MIVEVSSAIYKQNFPEDPHAFISDGFIELNKGKVEKVVRLIDNDYKDSIGLIAGIKDGTLKSPFSSPFGGFHFKHDQVATGVIDNFISKLQAYIVNEGLSKIEITLPPDMYHCSLNAKMINSLLRNGFSLATPEITNWINPQFFDGVFANRSAKKFLNQAITNKLTFHPISNEDEKQQAYELVRQNRERLGRPIRMTFSDLIDTSALWPVDFFRVNDSANEMVASAIIYRGHPRMGYVVFWADSEKGRPLRAMDYCIYYIWNHYKSLGYVVIDLGISTESGVPNEGLLHFKEIHNCTSSLIFSFSWEVGIKRHF